MKIEKVCKEILVICENETIPYKENKKKLQSLFRAIEKIEITSVKTLELVLNLQKSLNAIKNRKAIYIEDLLLRRFIIDLPYNLRIEDVDIPEDELEILDDKCGEEERINLRLSSMLLKYAKETLATKDDKSKRYKNRIKEVLRLINDLNDFYIIKDIKKIFQSKINDKDREVQFFALDGLANYYNWEDADKLTNEECQVLEKIIETTIVRTTASTCCQVMINAGIIDEFEALSMMDSWKEKNWN